MLKREGISMLESMTICKLKRLRFVQTVSIANSSYSEHIRSVYLIITSGHNCYGSYDP